MAVALLAAILMPAAHANAAKNGFDLQDRLVPDNEVDPGGPPRDCIAALDRLKLIPLRSPAVLPCLADPRAPQRSRTMDLMDGKPRSTTAAARALGGRTADRLHSIKH